MISISANSQPYLVEDEELSNLKSATLYVIMDTKTGKDDKYYDIFKEVWNYCAYEIIEPAEIVDHLSPDAFFMNLHVTIEGNSIEYTPTFKYLQVYELKIWKITPDYLRKMDRKRFRMDEINLAANSITVARIKLKADDSKSFFVGDMLSECDFMGSPYLLYTGPGMFKNYLKYLQTLLNKKLFYKEKEYMYNSDEIAKLRKSTLYIPKPILIEYKKDKNSKVKNKIVKIYDPKEIFADYPGKYELISLSDLDDRIIASDETFYYMNTYLTYDIAFKLIMTITNSNSGEIIFKDIMISSKSFPPKMIKNLSKNMNKL